MGGKTASSRGGRQRGGVCTACACTACAHATVLLRHDHVRTLYARPRFARSSQPPSLPQYVNLELGHPKPGQGGARSPKHGAREPGAKKVGRELPRGRAGQRMDEAAGLSGCVGRGRVSGMREEGSRSLSPSPLPPHCVPIDTCIPPLLSCHDPLDPHL